MGRLVDLGMAVQALYNNRRLVSIDLQARFDYYRNAGYVDTYNQHNNRLYISIINTLYETKITHDQIIACYILIRDPCFDWDKMLDRKGYFDNGPAV